MAKKASGLMQVKACDWNRPKNSIMWQPITTAPFEEDLELAVLDSDGEHALVFPCRRVPGGWVKCGTRQWVSVQPTHWREWREGPSVTQH
jgi:hypothetical protein